MLFNPRQINALYKIANCDDSFGSNCAIVYDCYVTLGFGQDVGGGRLPRVETGPKLKRDTLPFDLTASVASFPITNIAAVPNANNLSVLFSVSNINCSLSSYVRGLQRPISQSDCVQQQIASRPLLSRSCGNLGDCGIGQG